MEIRIAGVSPESIVDGPGLRFTLFVQGCPHNCEGCHNPQTHDFSGGKISTTEKLLEEMTENPLVKAVTFSGGEPFCQPEPLEEIAHALKEKHYGVMSYSGFTFEQLLVMGEKDENVKNLLACLDYLVDGKFILSLKSYELKFKGSSNQRILDIPESLKQGKAVEADI